MGYLHVNSAIPAVFINLKRIAKLGTLKIAVIIDNTIVSIIDIFGRFVPLPYLKPYNNALKNNELNCPIKIVINLNNLGKRGSNLKNADKCEC